MVEIRQVNRRDWLILQTSRVFGHVFALTLFGVVALAMIPNQFFIVSTRAVVNAPVQIIPSPIYGRVSEIDLQVGQVVDRGEVRASMSNPNQDQTSLTGLRLEKLDLTERLKNRLSDLARRKDQLQALIDQIDTVKAGIVSEQEAVVENAEATVKSFQAKVAEQDALLLQKESLAKKGIISKQSLDPLRQKRDAASFELDAAALDLKRQRIVHALVQQGTYTGGSIGTSLMTLEQQRKGLTGSIGEDEAAIGQMQDRSKELDSLIALEEKRVGGAESAQVIIQQRGQIVSVHASQGDFLSQGQPLARSLDCMQSFVAAVYAGRDVADLAIGTPAMVNLVSLGQKRSAHVWKIVRYFSSGVENRYFANLPTADGHEVYVFLKFDEGLPASGDQSSDDRFFGCHAGEDVVVSIGEPVIDKLARYYDVATASLLSSLAPDATASQPAKIEVGPVAQNDGLSTN
jgi:multidrug resistance efflux pump